jgi:hypothetical protein
VAAIGLINASLIIISTFVLTSRYVVALGLIIMLLAAFHMAALFREGERSHKLLRVALLIILSLSLIKNLWPKNDYHNYEQQSVAWVKEHGSIDSKIFYSSARVRYYASAPYTDRTDSVESIDIAIKNGSITSYDYLVLNIEDDLAEQKLELKLSALGFERIKDFHGSGNKKLIWIFAKK